MFDKLKKVDAKKDGLYLMVKWVPVMEYMEGENSFRAEDMYSMEDTDKNRKLIKSFVDKLKDVADVMTEDLCSEFEKIAEEEIDTLGFKWKSYGYGYEQQDAFPAFVEVLIVKNGETYTTGETAI